MALTPNSLARRKPGVQIPSPPPPTSQVRASPASSRRRSPLAAAAPRPRAHVAVQPGRHAATRRLGPGPSTATTERGRRLQPELRIHYDADSPDQKVALAQADGRAVRGHGGTAGPGPSWPCRWPPHRRAPPSHRCRHRGRGRGTRGHRPRDTGRPHRTVDSGSWTSPARTLDGHPDTGHRTRGRDRVLGQGDLGTAGHRTDIPDHYDHPTARWDAEPWTGDGACCARQRRRLGDDEVPASARLPTARPGACSVALSAKPRPGALLSSDEFRVERRASGSRSSVMADADTDC